MAGPERPAPAGVGDALVRDGHRKSFFVAAWLLSRAAGGAARVGRTGPPDREPVRFRVDPGLEFASADIAWIRRRGDRYEICVRFLGLHGTHSPLPTCFPEEILHQGEGGRAREFLDLLHHRILSLLYRAWERCRLWARFAEGDPLFAALQKMAVGGSFRSLQGIRMLSVLGMWFQAPRSAAAIRGILAEVFDPVPVRAFACSGGWTDLPPGTETRLGKRRSRLGRDALVGLRVRDPAGAFAVQLGPLDREQFESFLPGGARRRALDELIDRLRPDGLDCDVVLILQRDAVPPCELGKPEVRLGWSSWLGTAPRCPSLTFPVRGAPESVEPELSAAAG